MELIFSHAAFCTVVGAAARTTFKICTADLQWPIRHRTGQITHYSHPLSETSCQTLGRVSAGALAPMATMFRIFILYECMFPQTYAVICLSDLTFPTSAKEAVHKEENSFAEAWGVEDYFSITNGFSKYIKQCIFLIAMARLCRFHLFWGEGVEREA